MGLGAVILQEDEQLILQPIAYISRALSPASTVQKDLDHSMCRLEISPILTWHKLHFRNILSAPPIPHPQATRSRHTPQMDISALGL